MNSLKQHLSRQAYYLTYENEPVPTIVVHIHPMIVEAINTKVPKENPIELQTQNKVSGFPLERSFDQNWGFGNSSQNRGMIGSHLELAFPLHPKFSFSEEPCKECGGTGKNLGGEHKCWECRGEKKTKIDKPEIRLAYHSVNLLLRYMWYMKGDTGLYTDLELTRMYYGHASGNYCGNLQLFFDKNKGGANYTKPGIGSPYIDCPTVREAMMSVYKLINVNGTADAIDFEAYVTKEHGFFVRCPGQNGCYVGLDKLRGNDSDVEFSNHNIDTIDQQFALLTGLVMIQEVVLKDTLS